MLRLVQIYVVHCELSAFGDVVDHTHADPTLLSANVAAVGFTAVVQHRELRQHSYARRVLLIGGVCDTVAPHTSDHCGSQVAHRKDWQAEWIWLSGSMTGASMTAGIAGSDGNEMVERCCAQN